MWYMNSGGFFMWPILLMAIVALGVVIERYRTLRMLTTDNLALREEVLELMHAGPRGGSGLRPVQQASCADRRRRSSRWACASSSSSSG